MANDPNYDAWIEQQYEKTFATDDKEDENTPPEPDRYNEDGEDDF